jgi:uncharacterized protein (DUF1015 family)
MADVRLLCGLRYDARRVALQDVVCPPYDVISPAEARVFRANSPYNAVRLHMPLENDESSGQDLYAHAAAEFTRWQREGVLVRDKTPSLYLLEQQFRGPDGVLRRRRGFVGRLRLEDAASGVVLPHERTNPGPRSDRLALLRATHANLSQVFLLYHDEEQQVWGTLEEADRPLEPVSVRDSDGTLHSLQPACGPQAEKAAALLAENSLTIADGHHRYAAALAYRDERRAAGDHSADWCMAYFCGMDDPGLAVFAAHRLFKGIDLPPLSEVRRRLAGSFTIVAEMPAAPDDLPAMMSRLTDSGTAPVFGVVLAPERLALVVRLSDAGAVERLIGEGLAPAVASLPVTILHHLLLRDVFDVQPGTSEGLIDYYPRPEEAFERLRAGDHQLGVFLNAPSVDDVRRVTACGEVMPQKATYFFPKLLTGLVFDPLD